MASSYNSQSTPNVRIMPSICLVTLAIAGSLMFGFSFGDITSEQKKRSAGSNDCGTLVVPRLHGEMHTGHVAYGPMFFVGGLWSSGHNLAALAEIAVLGVKPEGRVVCKSLSWKIDTLLVTDVSPIVVDENSSAKPSLVVLSIDHSGADPGPDFAAAIQEHLQAYSEIEKVLVLTPLPGPTQRAEGEFPYDWTFLMVDEHIDVIDWVDIEPFEDLPGKPGSGYIKAWLDQESTISAIPLVGIPSDALLFGTGSGSSFAQRYWEAVSRGPYEVVPVVHQRTMKDIDGQFSDAELADLLLILRALGVHADAFIDRAVGSDNPDLRAIAARAIGELSNVTADPLGRLTPLAEDKSVRVRYETLVATRSIRGRRAAGVAQLVEPYQMSAAMRDLFVSTMVEMRDYGEPIPADSRVNRLRRMPIKELLAQERDAIVCAILLERPDLPDDQVLEIISELATFHGIEPLIALINVVETMNPRTLSRRKILLHALAGWEIRELEEHRDRLAVLANQQRLPSSLRSAAVGALINATPMYQKVVDLVGLSPVLFEGIVWVEQSQITDDWATNVLKVALEDVDVAVEIRIAAMDSIGCLHTDRIDQSSIAQLLVIARREDSIDLRFAAIKAIDGLSGRVKPTDISDLTLTRHTLVAVPGKMAYDKDTLRAVAGRPIEITLVNPDTMEHNLVITKPGRAQEIGVEVSAMPLAEAAAINYIPEMDSVLFYTDTVGMGESTRLRFIAPKKPGRYEFVCTYPGHYTSMIGVLELSAP